MSLKKVKSFRKTMAITTVATMLLGVSSLSAYEEKWNDKKAGDPVEKDGEKVPNSLFRLDGEIWGSYEFVDKKPNGEIDSYNGFRVGRSYVNIRGDVKEGEMKGWGYRITIDSETGAQSNQGASAAFVKYAYFNAPIFKGTSLRVGQQHIPTVDGQAGTSLQSIWGHRYLDDDGKAMWDELSMNSSTDIGVALIHKNRLFNLHLLLGNGESYKSTGNGCTVSGGAATCANVDGASSVTTAANGDSRSYGLDLYGMLSLTPLAKDEKDKGMLSISFPFRFQNIIGVQRDEYENLTAFDPALETFSYISGSKKALQDYAYGTEVDLTFKTEGMKFTVGGGTVIKVDRRADAILFSSTLATLDLTTNAGLDTFYTTNYARGSESRGQANYVFAHASFGKFGFVGRYSAGTGSGSVNERLGVSDGISTAERIVIQDIKNGNGIDGDVTTIRTFDQGRARFTKTLFGVTYAPNARFAATLGVSHITGQQGSGENHQANKLTGVNTYTTADSLATKLAPGTIVTDNDLIGEKNYDRQTFLRMVYKY